MTIETKAAVGSYFDQIDRLNRPWFYLLAGYLILAVPTILNLAQQTWTTELGAHGPIVLAIGLWLLYHDGLAPAPTGEMTAWRYILLLLIPCFALYIFGRAYDFISLEVFAVYGVFVAFLLRVCGFKMVKRRAFPIFYLGFIIPVPGWLLDRVTAPLQTLVSQAAEIITLLLGYPVARQGVSIAVGQYQLLVEDACAGMNSLVGLTAVSIFYIYLVRAATWRYAAFLVLLIVPVAILTNIIRVVVLIMITYHMGDQAAQGYLHATTGIVVFGVALLLISGADKLIWYVKTKLAR